MFIELLEPRIAPATVTLNPALKTATWTDFDGDIVTLKYSIGDAPQFTTMDGGVGLIVNQILLTPTEHTGGAFSIIVKKGPVGDGHASIGRVDATNVPLKSWISSVVDIAEFDAGDGAKGVGMLTIGGLGVESYTSFPFAAGNGLSSIWGDSGAVTIKGDVVDAHLDLYSPGKIKSVTISGNLRGDIAYGVSQPGCVSINALNIGPVLIGGSIVGGANSGGGGLFVSGKVASVLVKGNVIGGTTGSTGQIDISSSTSGPFSVLGSIIGSGGVSSALVTYHGSKTVTIGGSIIGGSEANSGVLGTVNPAAILVKGSLIGGSHTTAFQPGYTGVIAANVATSITILGDMIAGTYESGEKLAYNGTIFANAIGTVTVKGSMLGNKQNRAVILVSGNPAPAAPGNYKAIGKVIVGKDVTFAYIATGHVPTTAFDERIGVAENPDAGIGSVTVGGNWFHSSLSAGVDDVGSDGIGDGDTRATGSPTRHAVLGPVAIKGFVASRPELNGVSGFAAEEIVSIIAGGQKLFKSGDPARSLDTHQLIDIFEV